MCMYVSEICAEGVFVSFPWWLKADEIWTKSEDKQQFNNFDKSLCSILKEWDYWIMLHMNYRIKDFDSIFRKWK